MRKIYTIGKNNPFVIMAATKVMQKFLNLHDHKFHTSITRIKEFNLKKSHLIKKRKKKFWRTI